MILLYQQDKVISIYIFCFLIFSLTFENKPLYLKKNIKEKAEKVKIEDKRVY